MNGSSVNSVGTVTSSILQKGDVKTFKIAIAGDSTVADYPSESPIEGWGQHIGAYFNE